MKEPLLRVGDRVFLKNSLSEGEILSGPNRSGAYEVALGALRVWLPADQLKRNDCPSEMPKRPASGSLPSPDVLALTIDLHGYRVADAIRELDRAIDAAIIGNYEQIRVIHGRGSGALREAVLKYLRDSPNVENVLLDQVNPGICYAIL